MAKADEVSRHRLKIQGVQLADDSGEQRMVTLSLVDATPQPRMTRARGRAAGMGDPAAAGGGTGYTRTVPDNEDEPYRVGNYMTLVLLNGDHTDAADEETEEA